MNDRAITHCEADVLEGLAPFAMDELDMRFGSRVEVQPAPRPDAVAFAYRGGLDRLLDLRSVVAVSLVKPFAVPRPKALLGHQHLVALLAMVETARELWPAGRFATFKLGAAGAESSVMQRLKDEIGKNTGLRPAEEGDLLLRLRRNREGWEALVRLSPRPLATRPWRVCNMPGALNASLAHVMMMLTRPQSGDRVLNMACGSGTLLIERAGIADAHELIGCDTNANALECAEQNIAAARGHELAPNQAVRLEAWDATATPLAAASVDVICADLPFGQLVGSHQNNQQLYPKILVEASRIARPGARLALITHEIRLLEQAAAQVADSWHFERTVAVYSGGMTPRIFVWTRR